MESNYLELARDMEEKRPTLLGIQNAHGNTPLFTFAINVRKEMLCYIYSVTIGIKQKSTKYV